MLNLKHLGGLHLELKVEEFCFKFVQDRNYNVIAENGWGYQFNGLLKFKSITG